MSDIFDGTLDGANGEKIELARKIDQTREYYWNMGYKRGIFETREGSVQLGFDEGYHHGSLAAFCRSFIEQSGDDESKQFFEQLTTKEDDNAVIQLEKLITIINSRLSDCHNVTDNTSNDHSSKSMTPPLPTN